MTSRPQLSLGADFLRPARRPGRLAWVWCATGLAVLAVTGVDAVQAWRGRLAAVHAAERIDRPVPAAARQGGQPRPDAAVDAAARHQAEAAQWRARLAHPWAVIWAASEQAGGPGITWLGWQHTRRGELRLEGLASDEVAAEQAAQRLRQASAGPGLPWRDVALVRLERTSDGPRFEISALPAELPAELPAGRPATAAVVAR